MKIPSGFVLHHYDSLGSTNDEAKRLAADGAPHGTIVQADRQTAGRGRLGRVWESPDGNLYCSFVLRPTCMAKDFGQLSCLIAVVVAEAVEDLLRTQKVSIKWPNDILVEGKKISGMLLETDLTADGRLNWLVAGVGINIVSHPGNARFPATDLAEAEAVCCSPTISGDLLCCLANRLAHWLERWQAEGFAPVRSVWLEKAWRLGKEIEARTAHGDFSGIMRGLDDSGALLLQDSGGSIRTITAGEVFLETA